jgi:hypothetical protein
MVRNRRGVALGLVLWALVIGSAVLTVAVFIGMQERRAAGVGRRMQRAMTSAETGLADALVGWTPGLLGRRLLHPFDSIVIGGTGQGSAEPSWQGTIRRLNRGLFLVSVQAEDQPGTAVATVATLSRLGWVVRVRPVPLRIVAALEAGGIAVGDGARISGRDQPVPGWPDCPPPDSAVAGLTAGVIDTTDGSQVEGAPPIAFAAIDTAFPAARLALFDQLSSQATIELSPGSWSTGPSSSGGDCTVSDPRNWGDPSDPGVPCGDYWPIVHVSGDLHLLSGVGHGILLIDGDLVIDGPFLFLGLILVRGRVQIASNGSSVSLEGALIASQAGAAGRPLSGITITYSKCMVSNSLQSSGMLVPLRSRGWKQLF